MARGEAAPAADLQRRRARFAAPTTGRTPRSPTPPRGRSASSASASPAPSLTFPGLAHRMEEVGRLGRVLFINDFEGDQRRRGREGAAVVSRHPLDSRRQAEGGRRRAAQAFVPARRQGLPDRRGRRRFRAHARRRRSFRALGDARARRSKRRPRTRRARRRTSPWCCCRPPAPRSISSRISKRAATPFALLSPNGLRGGRRRPERAQRRRPRADGVESRTRAGRGLDAHRRPLADRVVRGADGDRPRDGARGQPGGRRAAQPLDLPLRRPAGADAGPDRGADDRDLVPVAAPHAPRRAGDFRRLVRAHHSGADVRRGGQGRAALDLRPPAVGVHQARVRRSRRLGLHRGRAERARPQFRPRSCPSSCCR